MQLHEMRRYAAIHGTPFVPVRWEDPTGDFNNSLAKWVHAQPTLYSQRRLAIPQVPTAHLQLHDTAWPEHQEAVRCCAGSVHKLSCHQLAELRVQKRSTAGHLDVVLGSRWGAVYRQALSCMVRTVMRGVCGSGAQPCASGAGCAQDHR